MPETLSGPSTVKTKDSRDDGVNAEANDDDDDDGPTDKRKAFWGTRCGGMVMGVHHAEVRNSTPSPPSPSAALWAMPICGVHCVAIM